MENHYLLGHGELALKGKNRSYFEKRLADNINRKAKKEGLSLKARLIYGKILVHTQEQGPAAEKFLSGVYGIATIRPVKIFPYDYETVKNELCAAVEEEARNATTFRITTNRAFKHFPVKSPQVSRELGGVILDGYPHLKVDLTEPDLEITVDIRSEGFFVSHRKLKGAGGFPEGTQGKALLLLSGGIDSPVAGHIALKKGLSIDTVYFHTPPFTGEAARQKVRDLAGVLKKESCRKRMRLYTVDISSLQTEMVSKCDKSAATILLRAIMVKTASMIAERGGYGALITGDSLGQVASQTLKSIAVVDALSPSLILRPLIGMDKSDIIALSMRTDTYEISNRPYDDCCSLFVPRHPQTRPVLQHIEKEFSRLNFNSFTEELDSHVEIEDI